MQSIIVDQTHAVLASGMLVLQKRKKLIKTRIFSREPSWFVDDILMSYHNGYPNFF